MTTATRCPHLPPHRVLSAAGVRVREAREALLYFPDLLRVIVSVKKRLN